MFGATGNLLSINYNHLGQIPVSTSGIVIFTINSVSDSNWVVSSVNNNLIKARNSNFSYANTSNTNGSASVSFTTVTNAAHDPTKLGTYATPFVQSTFVSRNSTIAYSSGSHNHAFSNTVSSSSFFPSHIKTLLYTRNNSSPSSFSLPVGTIVFSANITNNYGITPTSSYDNLYLYATNSTSLAGTTGGSTTFNLSGTSTSGGDHNHGPPSGGTDAPPWNGYMQATGQKQDITSKAHTHTLSISFTQNKKYVKLRTYVVQQQNVYISYGMIFGFNTSNVPADWYCCNGQTVNGYTTPNLVDRYVMCGNSDISSHNVNPVISNDINNISFLNITLDNNTWSHTHGTSGAYQSISTQNENDYHGTASVSHTHSVLLGQSFSYEPDHYNLIYYVYLPSP